MSAHPALFSYLDFQIGAETIDGAHITSTRRTNWEDAVECLLDPGVATANDRMVAFINQRLPCAPVAAAVEWGAIDVVPTGRGAPPLPNPRTAPGSARNARGPVPLIRAQTFECLRGRPAAPAVRALGRRP